MSTDFFEHGDEPYERGKQNARAAGYKKIPPFEGIFLPKDCTAE